ncbi:MAG: poly-gamma-glutamate synthase PgsB [Deltaproteobacteria bacterium]|nr:poly-gamma-glutamate synthase PgsB [Deltaproteobacteria bacterium]
MTLELLATAAGTLLGLGALELALHRRNLGAIPIRIHVAGTRGKSSVTRLVAGGLRAAGNATAAKTTGTLARMLLPDGREVPIHRPRGPTVTEQARIVAAAREVGARALVLECMALQPELHWVSESKLVRATHAIITNARADHLDVMGPTAADVARCLAGMVPLGGTLVTAERRHLPILAAACEDRGTTLLAVDDAEIAAISDEELSRFGHVEHRENVAVALRLLQSLSISREVALRGMWDAPADPGALTEHALAFFGRHIVFVNAFAANDPESTERIWNLARARHPELDRVIALFNLREDRPDRTCQLATDATFWRSADRVLVIGTGAEHFAREAARSGVGDERLTQVDDARLEDLFETIVEHCGRAALVVGMGNIGERGLDLVRMFRNRATLAAPEGATP